MALPGGYKVGEKVFYTGASKTLSSGNKLVHGQQGEVTGPGTSEATKGKGVAVRFPGNKGSIQCLLTAVSRGAPPPLPGGYKVGEKVFFTGTSQTYSDGDKLVHGQQGEVTGPATSEATKGKGVAVRFPGNTGNVSCLLTSVSRGAPPPLPGGYKLGEKVFYTRANYTAPSGNKWVHGQQGEVTGPATGEKTKGKGVDVRFPGNTGNVSCLLTNVSRDDPKKAAEKAAAKAAALGLLQPLEALSLEADKLRAATAAAVAYCDAQGAKSFADLVEHDLLDGLMASLTLKPVQANNLSQALKGPAVTAPPAKAGGAINSPGHWDFFLSHTQRDPLAVMLAEMLFSNLKDMGKTVWLDVHMTKRDMAAMEEGAKNCKCFLAIVTDNGQDSYFSRVMCRKEIKWAQVAERTIVPVCGSDDKKNIMTLFNGGKEHGVDLSSYNMVDIDRSAPSRIKASMSDVLEQAGML